MVYVGDFYEKYFLKHPNVSNKNFTRNIYLVTEDLDILKEALAKYLNNLCTVNPRPVAHGVVRIPQWASPGSDSRHYY